MQCVRPARRIPRDTTGETTLIPRCTKINDLRRGVRDPIMVREIKTGQNNMVEGSFVRAYIMCVRVLTVYAEVFSIVVRRNKVRVVY